MTETYHRFDAADYLDREDTIIEYLNTILEENDVDLLIQALGTIVRIQCLGEQRKR